MTRSTTLALTLAGALGSAVLQAQTRPLQTEEATTGPAGRLLLEVGQDGRRNWELGERREGVEASPAEGRGPEIPPFVLGEVRIEDGAVTYDDRSAATSRRAEAIELAVSQAGPDQPVTIEGGVTVDARRAAWPRRSPAPRARSTSSTTARRSPTRPSPTRSWPS